MISCTTDKTKEAISHAKSRTGVEHLPVTISFLEVLDMNVKFIIMVEECLISSGRPTKVETGPNRFEKECCVPVVVFKEEMLRTLKQIR